MRIATMALPEVSLIERTPQCESGTRCYTSLCYVESAHDCSEGGILVAATEMAFGGRHWS